MRTKHLKFKVGKLTVAKIVPEICEAMLWYVLQPIVLPTPDADRWKKINEEYIMKWQFPIGALNGRYMEIEKPPCCRSIF